MGNEDIVCMLRHINALLRRGPKKPSENGMPPPPPPHEPGRGRLMGLLADNGEMNQSAIAALLEIRPQSLSELLSKAEADGLIRRRQSEDDKRQIIVSLTDEGSRRVGEFREAQRRRTEKLLSSLSENEKEELARLLGKIIESNREE